MAAPRVLSPYVSLAAFFGSELRRYRERRGWSQPYLSSLLPWSESLVGKIERGERLPPEGFGAYADKIFDLPETLSHLEKLCHEAPSWFTRFVALEASATKISMWDMRLVPGLLQTPEYARVVVRATQPRAADETVEEVVADRMARQLILDRPNPPILSITLHESVVRQPLPDTAIARRQIEHLMELARRPYVTLRVLPYAAACIAGASGPFYIFGFADQPDVGTAEGRGLGRLIDGEELTDLSLIYDRLTAAALTEERSIGLLTGAWDAVWTSTTR